MVDFTGTEGADVFAGTAEADVVYGQGGDDILSGGDQSDTILGGAGADVIEGGAGNDSLVSANGSVIMPGVVSARDPGSEHDVIVAGSGDDRIWAGYGDDVDGGEGIDTLYLSLASSPVGITHKFSAGDFTIGGANYKSIENYYQIYGSQFDDDLIASETVQGIPDNQQIFGLSGNDRLIGSVLTGLIDGGDGDDYISSGDGRANLYGGAGNDVLLSWHSGIVYGDDGNDNITANGLVYAGNGDDKIYLNSAISFSNIVVGAAGGNGNDQFYAQSESVVVYGESGSDTFLLGEGNDIICTDGNVQIPISPYLYLQDKNADLDTVKAGGGNDRIFAGWGDIVDGGAGTDLLNVNLGGANAAVDVTIATVATTDVTALGTGSFTGIETLVVGGTDFNDRFVVASTVLTVTVAGGSGDDEITTGAKGVTVTGGIGNDTLISGVGGADIFNGGVGIDTIDYRLAAAAVTVKVNGLGADGDQMTDVENVVGSRFDDRLTGDTLDNVLDGGAGADILAGGLRNDTYIIDQSDTIVENAGEGIDTVVAGFSYVLSANLENLTLTGALALAGTGNAANNVLTGNAGNNVLLGLDGNDVLDGGAGVDRLEGGAGDDVYVVDSVIDRVVELAGGGTDRIDSSVTLALVDQVENLRLTGNLAINGTGNALNNAIYGNAAANVIDGRGGSDLMVGGAGDDTYVVDSTGDEVRESYAGGIDTVRSSADWTLGSEIEHLTLTGGADVRGTGNNLVNVLTGNGANNVLSGLDGADTLLGLAGNDTLIGGAGWDTMDGGAGSDVYVLNSATEHYGAEIADSGSSGVDEVRLSSLSTRSYKLFAGDTGIERVVLDNAAPDAHLFDPVNIDLTALTYGVEIIGNRGDNVIYGTAFADRIDGGGGIDQLRGGAGDDVYLVTVDGARPSIVELADGGFDRVESAISFILDQNVENLTLTGTKAISGTGNALVNTIIGNDANNVLDGAAGADILRGGLGDDTYVVDTLADKTIEAADGGSDTVQTGISWTLAANIENLTLTGTAASKGTGNELDNRIDGNGAANVIDGRAGADTMYGWSGADTYMVDNAGDKVVEFEGQGVDTVRASISYTLNQNVENLVLTGSDAIDGTGNWLANTITGNDADNVLDGGAGTDILRGALGNDTYVVDSLADQVIESIGGGTDTVQSSVSYVLGYYVENLTLTGAAAINGDGNALDNVLTGNDAGNLLRGAAGDDRLVGGGGHDRLEGGVGNDRLEGGSGTDEMYGGAGDDVYLVDDTFDRAIEGVGAGNDTVFASTTFTLGAYVETLVLLDGGAFDGTGNQQDNTLVGNASANVLSGGQGKDVLLGLGGSDTLRGGMGADTFSFAHVSFDLAAGSAATADRILDFSHAEGDRIDLAPIGVAGGPALSFIGTAAFSGAAGEVRQEASGADTLLSIDLDGNGSADQFIVLSGAQTLVAADFIL